MQRSGQAIAAITASMAFSEVRRFMALLVVNFRLRYALIAQYPVGTVLDF